MRMFHVVMVALLVSGCVAPTSPSTSDPAVTVPLPSGTLSPTGADVVTASNAERARAGLNPLTTNAQLNYAAQLQADQCARLGRIDHVLPEAMYPRPEDRVTASGYAWRTYGENLAIGYTTGAEAVQGWMGSTDHRANLLNATFTEVGVGFTVDEAGRTYFVQVFGSPR